MADTPTNNNYLSRHSPSGPEPDAHGQAALLLAESTLHALIEAKSLTHAQAVQAVQTAADVKVDAAEEHGESNAATMRSLGLLNRVEESLRSDGNKPPAPLSLV